MKFKAYSLITAVGIALISFSFGVYVTEYRKPPYHLIEQVYWRVQQLVSPTEVKKTRGGTLPGWLQDDERRNDAMDGLGYIQGVETNSPGSGVVLHHSDSSWEGLNFYVSGHAAGAFLMSMDGSILHRWQREWSTVFSGSPAEHAKHGMLVWTRATPLPDGSVVATYSRAGIIKIDASSELIWKNNIRTHHDFDITSDGRIWVLSSKQESVLGMNQHPEYENDYVTVLSRDGKVVEEFSIWKAMRKSPYSGIHRYVDPGSQDFLHTNTLEVIDPEEAANTSHPAFKAGNVILSSRNVHLLMVLDPEKEQIVWAEGGLTSLQHNPLLTSNGNLLVFDNKGKGKGREYKTRLVEFDPRSGQIKWQYRGQGLPSFKSVFGGALQELPNGNILVSETGQARAFEVTKDGKLTWVFHNPHALQDDSSKRGSLFGMSRYPVNYFSKKFTRSFSTRHQ